MRVETQSVVRIFFKEHNTIAIALIKRVYTHTFLVVKTQQRRREITVLVITEDKYN